MLGVDPEGLDDGDRKLLRAVVELFDGGPVGLSTLAAALNEDAPDHRGHLRPFLIQKGFLERNPRGRKATRGTFAYLGFEPSSPFRQLSLLEEPEG
jgi:Holliday junction DNA helicase RuvB